MDSLQTVLKNQTGAERYPTLHRLAIEYVDVDNVKALEVISQAVDVALISRDTLSIVKSLRAKAQILSRLGRVEKVLSILPLRFSVYHLAGYLDLLMIENTGWLGEFV